MAVVGPQGRSGLMRKISPPTGIRSPDRSARSESLYGLSYPGHIQTHICYLKPIWLILSFRNSVSAKLEITPGNTYKKELNPARGIGGGGEEKRRNATQHHLTFQDASRDCESLLTFRNFGQSCTNYICIR